MGLRGNENLHMMGSVPTSSHLEDMNWSPGAFSPQHEIKSGSDDLELSLFNTRINCLPRE